MFGPRILLIVTLFLLPASTFGCKRKYGSSSGSEVKFTDVVSTTTPELESALRWEWTDEKCGDQVAIQAIHRNIEAAIRNFPDFSAELEKTARTQVSSECETSNLSKELRCDYNLELNNCFLKKSWARNAAAPPLPEEDSTERSCGRLDFEVLGPSNLKKRIFLSRDWETTQVVDQLISDFKKDCLRTNRLTGKASKDCKLQLTGEYDHAKQTASFSLLRCTLGVENIDFRMTGQAR